MNDYINDKLKAGETVEKEQVNFLQWAVATQNTLLAETKKRDDVTHEIMNEYRKFLRENRYLKSTIFYKYKCKAMFIKGKKAIKKQETLKYD